MNSSKIKKLVTASLFAAIIAVLTATIHIPIGTTGGYLHLGDTFIFIAACVLPKPYACASAAIGGAIADILVAPLWAPFTIIVKALIVIAFTSKNDKIVCTRNIIAIIPALIITCAGYYAAEGILYGNWIAPTASLPFNTVQIVASGIFFIVLGLAFDKAKIKKLVRFDSAE